MIQKNSGDNIMEYKNQLDLIMSQELFWGISEQEVSTFLTEDMIEEKSFKSGEVVMSRDSEKEVIGIVVSGVCHVLTRSNAYIGLLEKGNIFGCQSLYIGIDSFPNIIKAKGAVDVLFIKKSAIDVLVTGNPGFALSYIRYLSKRISYLNYRIRSYTARSAESCLALFLLENFGDYKTYSLPESITSLSESLNIGRASLYRSFDKLEEAGAIKKEGKVIRLINKDVLETFC